MLSMFKTITIGIIALPLIAIAHQTSTTKKPWHGSVHFGMVANGGNSRNENTYGKLSFKYLKNKWELHTAFRGQLAEDKQGKTEDNYQIMGDAKYHFHKSFFGFARASYDYDQFNPYLYIVNGIVGLGFKAIKKDNIKLNLQLGPGYRHQKEAGTKKIDNDIIAYSTIDFSWKFAKHATFKQQITMEDGARNTYTYSKTAVLTNLTKNLGLEISYILKHNTKIPKFSKNTYKSDTITQIALVYNF